MLRTVTWKAATLLIVCFLGACGPLIADYSLEAYKSATSLKAEVGSLIDKSGEPYVSHKKEVDALTTKINAAYEFAAGQPYNSISAAQWDKIRNPTGNLYGGFVRIWRDNGSVSPGYRREKKGEIDSTFDELICLEANKQAPKPCPQTGPEAETSKIKNKGRKS